MTSGAGIHHAARGLRVCGVAIDAVRRGPLAMGWMHVGMAARARHLRIRFRRMRRVTRFAAIVLSDARCKERGMIRVARVTSFRRFLYFVRAVTSLAIGVPCLFRNVLHLGVARHAIDDGLFGRLMRYVTSCARVT